MKLVSPGRPIVALPLVTDDDEQRRQGIRAAVLLYVSVR